MDEYIAGDCEHGSVSKTNNNEIEKTHDEAFRFLSFFSTSFAFRTC